MSGDYQLGEIPAGWRTAIGASASPDALGSILGAVLRKSDGGQILPRAGLVFAALVATPLENVRALILGQDPYPTPGYAMGLAFSVPNGVLPLPQSLQNIRKELRADLHEDLPDGGSLKPGHNTVSYFSTPFSQWQKALPEVTVAADGSN